MEHSLEEEEEVSIFKHLSYVLLIYIDPSKLSSDKLWESAFQKSLARPKPT